MSGQRAEHSHCKLPDIADSRQAIDARPQCSRCDTASRELTAAAACRRGAPWNKTVSMTNDSIGRSPR